MQLMIQIMHSRIDRASLLAGLFEQVFDLRLLLRGDPDAQPRSFFLFGAGRLARRRALKQKRVSPASHFLRTGTAYPQCRHKNQYQKGQQPDYLPSHLLWFTPKKDKMLVL